MPRLPCIANFDDLDPLSQNPDVNVNIITQGMVIPSDSDVILLAGSKSTLGDLQCLKDNGWDIDIIAHNRRGRLVMGICAGFQMLGTAVHDPEHVEGTIDSLKGLGLLDIETVMRGDKKLVEVQGTSHFTNTKFSGYEMHMGETSGASLNRPFATLAGRNSGDMHDGAISIDGTVIGTYIHGIFNDDDFLHAFLNTLHSDAISAGKYEQCVEDTLDDLACHMEEHIDIDALLDIA